MNGMREESGAVAVAVLLRASRLRRDKVVLNAFIMFFSLVFFASVLTAGGV